MTLTMVSVALAQGIANSAHDFSTGSSYVGGWQGSSDQICIYCHAPHNNANAAGELLWNHALSVQTYTPYSSPTMASTAGTPDATSKLCLSCHDGTVALDSYGGVTGTTNMFTQDPNRAIAGSAGNDLSDSHPISIDYIGSSGTPHPDIAAGGLYDPDTQSSGITGGGTVTASMLYANKVECSSCHDVHNKYNQSFLLKKSNTASALCLTCHIK